MILLTAASEALRVVTAGTQTIDCTASYVDGNGSTIGPGVQDTAISSVATTNIVPGPSAGQRNIKFVAICNKDTTSSVGLIVQRYNGTTAYQILKLTLLAGYTLTYNDLDGWVLIDAAGGRVETPLAGRFLKRTVILTGTTSFVAGPSSNTIIARMLAGGGQGGGAPAVAGECGSGGGAGSYAEWVTSVVPNTTYTCAVGAGGSTGGTGATGQTGGNTTLAIGGTTVACNGGVGGVAGTSLAVPVLGGAGGAISTNGTVNTPGNAGYPSVNIGTAADNASGRGADSEMGNGGATLLEGSGATGNAAGGFGSGGGGASTTGTAKAGGAGAPGVIIIDEYS